MKIPTYLHRVDFYYGSRDRYYTSLLDAVEWVEQTFGPSTKLEQESRFVQFLQRFDKKFHWSAFDDIQSETGVFFFRRLQDATLFKLVWG
jgi:hypothetical protein